MTFTMTQEQFTQMTRIYNTLLEVQTAGQNSFLMVDSLRAFEQVMKDINDAAQRAAAEASETAEG